MEVSILIFIFTLLLWVLERDLYNRYVRRARLPSIRLRKKASSNDIYQRTLRMYKLDVKRIQTTFSPRTTYHRRKKTLIIGKDITSRQTRFTIIYTLFQAVLLCKKNKSLESNWIYSMATTLKWSSLFCAVASCFVYVYFPSYKWRISCFWVTFLVLYAFVVLRCLVENDMSKKILKAAATDKNILMEEESVGEFARFASFLILTCALRYGTLLPFFVAISVFLEK